ncbi:hypothetical protein ACSMFT_15395 [Ectopseudomonas oleovorans]|uniref:hypothetical protein n=1 Tax=Ectopseudomonas oleovorans TaxID=301 RepID=UPI003F1D2671
MGKYYAVCNIAGLIRLTDERPGDGQFALAVGDFSVLVEEIHQTAVPHYESTEKPGRFRVPETLDDAEPRANLAAIAYYIQVLAKRGTVGIRALGV